MGIYKLYGLVIETPFQWPTLPEARPGEPVDVVVQEGWVPRQLENRAAGDISWDAAPGQYLLRGGQQAGRFLVEDGQRITLYRNPEAQEVKIALYFLDTIIAALLQQRGFLNLHANAAVVGDVALAVSGHSGAGKSTTLGALLDRGCRMLTDDLTVLSLDHQGRVIVLPGVPQMHLSEEAAGGLGKDISHLQRHPWRLMKAVVPTGMDMAEDPAPLKALFLLEKDTVQRLQVETLGGTRKFDAIQTCFYGPLLPGEHPRFFPLMAKLVEQVQVFRIRRPEQDWTVDQVVEYILDKVA